MGITLRLLVVEDSEDDTLLLLRELKHGGFDPTYERVDTPEAMISALSKQKWDVVICDYNMPQFSAPSALMVLKQSGVGLPFIIVSGSIGEETAVAAMKLGAHDYIMKNNMKRLVAVIERELREAEIRREHEQAKEKVQHLANYDIVTGLPNRTLLQDRLEQAILVGRRENKPLALILMDLDHFKEINNTLGYHKGDLLLQQVASRLRSALREPDTVARLNGDEFAVLLPLLTAAEHVSVVAEKILKALEEPFQLEGLTLDVKTSIGIALFPDHSEDADTLIRRADVAMYAAKQAGLDWALYKPEFDQYTPLRLALMSELRYAIERDELVLYFQPKLSLKTERIIGVEALVRWQHPNRGLIPPDHFIKLAEETGLIKSLTLWVLNQALSQCRAWHQQGNEIRVSVNLSARNLQDSQLPEQVDERLKAHGLDAMWLELEITESAIMSDPTLAMSILMRLSQMGIGLSIDDFGTGYSSLAYLKKLPVESIKIDRSFVRDMAKDEDDAVIVRSTIDLAHNLGLKVVAEGVEDQEIWNRLAILGCDEAQGYYMSRPISAAEFTRWLSQSPWGLKRAAGDSASK